MRVTHVFSGIPTADFPSALGWYETFFGRPPDNRPHEHEAVWQLTESGLIDPGEVETLATGPRRVAISDPDGNGISIAQVH